ncbi:MAG: hypothetical protein HY735_21710 [Verrucomicrobia bacterium]|nr:hypothetical protein [Verrucomicrobiota bacterium]
MLLSYMCHWPPYSTSDTVCKLMSQYLVLKPIASQIEQLMPEMVLHMVKP